MHGWLGSRVVSLLDSGAEGPGFKSQPRCCRVTSLKQTVHTHCASAHQAGKLVAAFLRVAGGTAGLAESNGSLPTGLMTHSHITCRLTTKNRDQLRNPTLGNRVWATCTFIPLHSIFVSGPVRPLPAQKMGCALHCLCPGR